MPRSGAGQSRTSAGSATPPVRLQHDRQHAGVDRRGDSASRSRCCHTAGPTAADCRTRRSRAAAGRCGPRPSTAPAGARHVRQHGAVAPGRHEAAVDQHARAVVQRERRDDVVADAPVVHRLSIRNWRSRLVASRARRRADSATRASRPRRAAASHRRARAPPRRARPAARPSRACGARCQLPAAMHSTTNATVATSGSQRGRRDAGSTTAACGTVVIEAVLHSIDACASHAACCVASPCASSSSSPSSPSSSRSSPRSCSCIAIAASGKRVVDRAGDPRRAVGVAGRVPGHLVQARLDRAGRRAIDRASTRRFGDEKAARARRAASPAPRARLQPVDQHEQQQPDDVDEVPVPRGRLEREVVLARRSARGARGPASPSA